MSKAFTKEDDEIPERNGRKRTAAGLPPGAINYLSEKGARLLRDELVVLEKSAEPAGAIATHRLASIREVLASATIVPTRAEPPEEALFGTTVTIRAANGELSRQRIVGVDETGLEPGWISWLSPLAKALLGARIGQHIQLPEGTKAEVVEIAE